MSRIFAWLVIVAVLIGGVAGGYLLGWIRGFRRGRDVERMRLPERGTLHFADGPMREVYAVSPAAALDVLVLTRGGR
jgi:hypothetical protein